MRFNRKGWLTRKSRITLIASHPIKFNKAEYDYLALEKEYAQLTAQRPSSPAKTPRHQRPRTGWSARQAADGYLDVLARHSRIRPPRETCSPAAWSACLHRPDIGRRSGRPAAQQRKIEAPHHPFGRRRRSISTLGQRTASSCSRQASGQSLTIPARRHRRCPGADRAPRTRNLPPIRKATHGNMSK